ncbi:MAG: DUF3168 domain-containing protein [Pseudomonadota bacterium]
MENLLRADLIDWLRDDPALVEINAIEEESPLRVSPPWLGISASASIDWGTKDRSGREIRLALELESRIDDPAVDATMLSAIESRVLDLPPFPDGYELASIHFLRARSERRDDNRRAALLEFRFRLFQPITE